MEKRKKKKGTVESVINLMDNRRGMRRGSGDH